MDVCCNKVDEIDDNVHDNVEVDYNFVDNFEDNFDNMMVADDNCILYYNEPTQWTKLITPKSCKQTICSKSKQIQ